MATYNLVRYAVLSWVNLLTTVQLLNYEISSVDEFIEVAYTQFLFLEAAMRQSSRSLHKQSQFMDDLENQATDNNIRYWFSGCINHIIRNFHAAKSSKKRRLSNISDVFLGNDSDKLSYQAPRLFEWLVQSSRHISLPFHSSISFMTFCLDSKPTFCSRRTISTL